MNFEITQSVQRKLERRIVRFRNVDGRFLPSATKQFFAFLEDEPILKGILKDLEIKISLDENKKSYYGWEDLTKIGNEYDLLKIAFIDLKNLANNNYGLTTGSIANNFGFQNPDNSNQAREFVFIELIQPFCDYFLEQLDSQKVMLNLLYRYKHRCEWFQQERLLNLYENNTEIGEKLLALDLYQNLFDEGIDFTIEPSSLDGEIDLIAAQNSDDPLLADAKVFSGSKTKICYGFSQIYSYTKKYNEAFGYLVIYNVKEKDLSLLFSNSANNIPVITYNHKTIFFVTIDLYKHKSPSKRGKIKPLEIKEKDLFEYIESIEAD